MSEYIPDGYCDMVDAFCAAYRSLYPRSKHDTDMQNQIAQEIERLRHCAMSDLESDSLNLAREVADHPGNKHKPEPSQQELLASAKSYAQKQRKKCWMTSGRLKKFLRQLKAGTDVPPLAFWWNTPCKEISTMLERTQPGSVDPSPEFYDQWPRELQNFKDNRKGATTRALRGALCEGRVTAYCKRRESGIVAFQDSNYWLIDPPASRAMMGTEAEVQSPPSMGNQKYHLLFKVDELASVFPPKDRCANSSEPTTITRPRGRAPVVPSIASFLQEHWPHGSPEAGWCPEEFNSIAEWRDHVVNSLKVSANDDTFLKARQAAYVCPE